MCEEENPCSPTEYTISSSEEMIDAALCLSATISSEFEAPPVNKAFKYDFNKKLWADLFVGNEECATFFDSPLDSKLSICADVESNKPSSIVDDM